MTNDVVTRVTAKRKLNFDFHLAPFFLQQEAW